MVIRISHSQAETENFSSIIEVLCTLYMKYGLLCCWLRYVVQPSYAKVEMFGISKKEWLSTFLKLEYGIPDACTFRNIIKEIDIEKLHTFLVNG